VQSSRLGEGDRPLISAEVLVEGLQELLAPGEVGIARQGNAPAWGERSQTSFQKLPGRLIIQAQLSSQFEDHGLTGREIVPLFPAPNGVPMHPQGLGQLLLGQVPVCAMGSQEGSEGRKIA
jgi:hypothetical protein